MSVRSRRSVRAIGAPVAPLGLLVAVETIPDIMRTLGNVMLDLATTATLHFRGEQGRIG